VEERKMISDNNHQFRSQLSALSSNQTELKNNISTLVNQLEIISSQLKQLNSSVITLLEELDAAPYLKTLPGEVSDVQKQVAQFGSRLTDLESQLTKSDTELRSDLGEIKSDLAKTKEIENKTGETNLILENRSIDPLKQQNSSENSMNIEKLNNISTRVDTLDNQFSNLDKKFRFFGANLTEQLQRQEERASQGWKLIGDLQDDIQNVSAKVYSDEIRFKETQTLLTRLQNDFSDFSQKVSEPDSHDLQRRKEARK